tara:strand:+ start:1547 stop:1918 length:372 start_codon:yes stop_codon:yes gene_type:complete
MKFPLTKQEAFDAAYIGVVNQGYRNVDNGICVYNSANGGKCAAGFVFAITNPSENPDSFKATLGIDARAVMIRFGYEDKDMSKFLCEIQTAHDYPTDECFVHNFKVEMHRVALKHKLNTPEVA